MNTPSQIHDTHTSHTSIDENRYIQFNKNIDIDAPRNTHTNSEDIVCCQQKIDSCIVTYLKYLFFIFLLLTNICNIVLNYKILNK